MNPWVNFLVVVGVQFLVFLVFAHQTRLFKKITLFQIVKGAVLGMVLGIIFDFVVGKYLGIFNYTLGFNLLFLAINGGLSYGLWILTIQLLRRERFFSFLVSTILIGLVYEIANYFSPVWSWTFADSFWYQESIVILVAYCGLAMLAAFGSSLTTKTKFKAFTFKLQR